MRFRTIRVALVTAAAAVVVSACAADHIMAGKHALGVTNVAGLTFRRSDGANLDYIESEGSSTNLPCTDASLACMVTSLHPAGTDWVFFGDTYLKAQPGEAQAIYTTGEGKVSRGYLNPWSQTTILNCGHLGGRSCPDVKYLSNTCDETVNSATLTTRHVVKLTGSLPGVGNQNAPDGCDGPSPDQCAAGTSDSATTYATRVGVITGGRAHLNCGTGGGDPVLNCDVEWIELEISYDGGATWQPFWSGWGDVCDLWAE